MGVVSEGEGTVVNKQQSMQAISKHSTHFSPTHNS